MYDPETLFTQGEHSISIPSPEGFLEAIWSCPEQATRKAIAIICHPLPTGGGTMHNKVVTTVAKAFRDMGVCSVRFNFRGVGASPGMFDHGVGETADLHAVINWAEQMAPNAEVYLAGFSFGSYISYHVASEMKPSLLITIAPPVHHYPYRENARPPCPWIVIQGEDDEIVPADEVFAWIDNMEHPPRLVPFPNTGHFVHGKLVLLHRALQNTVYELMTIPQ